MISHQGQRPGDHIVTPPAQYTLSTDLSVVPHQGRFAVRRVIWFIDKAGDKDRYDDILDSFETELEAIADLLARQAGGA